MLRRHIAHTTIIIMDHWYISSMARVHLQWKKFKSWKISIGLPNVVNRKPIRVEHNLFDIVFFLLFAGGAEPNGY